MSLTLVELPSGHPPIRNKSINCSQTGYTSLCPCLTFHRRLNTRSPTIMHTHSPGVHHRGLLRTDFFQAPPQYPYSNRRAKYNFQLSIDFETSRQYHECSEFLFAYRSKFISALIASSSLACSFTNATKRSLSSASIRSEGPLEPRATLPPLVFSS